MHIYLVQNKHNRQNREYIEWERQKKKSSWRRKWWDGEKNVCFAYITYECVGYKHRLDHVLFMCVIDQFEVQSAQHSGASLTQNDCIGKFINVHIEHKLYHLCDVQFTMWLFFFTLSCSLSLSLYMVLSAVCMKCKNFMMFVAFVQLPKLPHNLLILPSHS